MIQETYNYKILLVGCGNMGEPILQALLSSNLDIEMYVIDPHKKEMDLSKSDNLSLISSLEDLPVEFIPNIILFTIKPQIIAQIAPQYKKLINNDTIIISILAGIKVDFFNKIFAVYPDCSIDVKFRSKI